MRATRSLWGRRDFLLLWSAQSVNLLGTHVSLIAVPLLALSVGATPFQVSLVAAAGHVPYLLAALPAGAVVDRCRRRPIMLTAGLLQGLALSTVPIAGAFGALTFSHLLAAAFTVALLGVFFDTAYGSYLPSLVPRERLADANGKLGASDGFAYVAGQSAAGALVAWIGAAWTVGVDAVSYLLAAGFLGAIRHREPPPAAGRPPGRARERAAGFRAEIAEGLRVVFRHRLLRPLFLADAFVNAGIAASWSIWVVHVVEELRWPAYVVGLSQGLSALGVIAGGFDLGGLGRRFGMPAVLLAAAPFYVLDLLPTLLVGPGVGGQVVVTAGYLVALFGEFTYVGASRTLRQLLCPPRLLGRVTSISRWVAQGPRPFVAVAFGGIATAFGTRTALVLAAVLFAVPFAILVTSPIRLLRDVPGPEPEPGSGPRPGAGPGAAGGPAARGGTGAASEAK
ncbi:MFS transporter [Bailinhaonella thermotolerans]|uniref:MFS transporter n=1 Tax=Bailinhaonella thermotolerans TaxID=1070861 RepID=A0A3A4A4N0_9ACTN|nr:MFS transporter [Bailinhaonella thermotolerans]RJL22751.1 MFS transporter [Bailinhaonella thermotolerans]